MPQSIFIGFIAAICSNIAVFWRGKTTVDDTLDIFPCHGIGGIVGMICTGIFASKKINPAAYYHLNFLKEVQHVQEEEIGNLSYFSIYAPVRDEKGVMYAYLNIPYFESQNNLQDEISNFLVTIINLNAFIFLVAGIIALFITNRITRSFSLISDKMKEVNLEKTNEEKEQQQTVKAGLF